MNRQILFACSFLSLACASKVGVLQKDADGHSEFPKADELRKLKTQPPPVTLFDPKEMQPDSWEVAGPLTDEERATLEQSPLFAQLQQAVSARGGLVSVSPAMHCVAREYARFRNLYAGRPVDSLADFITGRCGVTDPSVSTQYIFGDVGTATDADVLAKWKPDLDEMMTKSSLFTGVRSVGIAYSREGSKVTVLLASSKRMAHLTAAPVIGADGSVVVEGDLLQHADRTSGVFNKGAYSMGHCSGDASVSLPHFRFTCALDKNDANSWIEIGSWAPGRSLGSVVAQILVSPNGTNTRTWRPASPVDLSGTTATGTHELLLAAVNVVRSGAGMKPMTLEVGQSNTAQEVAPYYFGALNGDAPETYADFISLGLMAGYDVSGIVFDSAVTAATVRSRASPSTVVANAIEKPWARRVLLDVESTRLAVGALEDKDHNAMAVLFSSYELLDRSQLTEATAKVRRKFDEAREKKQKAKALAFLAAQEPMQSALTAFDRGNFNSQDALQSAMSGAVARSNKGVSGYRMERSDLDSLDFPDVLVDTDRIQVHIEVTHIKNEEHPWGRYLILIIYADPGEAPAGDTTA